MIGEILNIISHGNGSNGFSKINDKLVCSAAECFFYIYKVSFYCICIDPIKIVQQAKLFYEKIFTVIYIYTTRDNYLYCKGKNQNIHQFKIIVYKDNNFIELKEIGIYRGRQNYNNEKAILPFDDGRIFLIDINKNQKYIQIIE